MTSLQNPFVIKTVRNNDQLKYRSAPPRHEDLYAVDKDEGRNG